MPLFDFPLEELQTYRAPDTPPADFAAFWDETLHDAAAHSLAATFEPVDTDLYRHAQVFDVAFAGFGGQRVAGWLILPPDAGTSDTPCLVSYIGYGGGRSLPIEHLGPVAAGVAHFVMDTRGQGAGWSPGDTPDAAGSGPQAPGFLTRGIDNPQDYYYRRVYADAVRAVAAAAAHPAIDAGRIAVGGGSQGGGIALAVAGLIPDQVKVLLADVPFLCHFRRAIEITDRLPYREIVDYLKTQRTKVETALATLAYFDGVHFAPRVTARTLCSVGLMDMVCPPSTVFAAYNAIAAEKEMRVYRFNEHEGGDVHHATERLRFLKRHI
jgi:cephalosporin-C deacetylase